MRSTPRLDRSLIVTATNLAFSVELYLKALCLLDGEQPPGGGGGHNLMMHYNLISTKRLATVEAIYANLVKGREKPPSKLMVRFPRIGDSTPAPPLPKTPSDTSFRTVLDESKDVFVHWRYFYKRSLPDQIRTLAFHFDCLDLIANALDTHLTTVFGGRLVTGV